MEQGSDGIDEGSSLNYRSGHIGQTAFGLLFDSINKSARYNCHLGAVLRSAIEENKQSDDKKLLETHQKLSCLPQKV